MEEFMTNWFNDLEEEEQLIRELLDSGSPFSVLTTIIEPESDHLTDAASNHLDASNVCMEPPIQDTENELWKARRDDESNERRALPTGISILEKGLNKMDHKYTLKVKSCGDALADDGYKWRKYGQKSIKNSPYPRSYFRCTNPKCCAKKQVERCSGDPDTLIITYEGLHLHYTFSHFLSTQPDQACPPTKKFKKTIAETQDTSKEPQAQECSPLTDPTLPNPTTFGPHQVLFESVGQQGLLEDVVPLNILKPSIVNTLSNSSSSSSSYPTSPPKSSSSSLTWSPKFPSFDVGATSSMI